MFAGTSARSWWIGLACLAGLTGNAADPGRAKESMVSLKDLAVVDCLLPGQVRQLGSTNYLTQRRPIRTDAADCRKTILFVLPKSMQFSSSRSLDG